MPYIKSVVKSVLLLFLIISCGSDRNNSAITSQSKKRIEAQKPDLKPDLAVQFINDYIKNLKSDYPKDIRNWVERNPYVTSSFKSELGKLIEKAFEENPEYGLGFDPILDAQDFDETGYLLKSFDDQTGYLTVEGKKAKSLVITMKVIAKDNLLKVDGSGIVNIPAELQ